MESLSPLISRYLIREMPLDQILIAIDQNGFGVLKPDAHRFFNGVVAAPDIVSDLILGKFSLALIGDLPALIATENLQYIVLLADLDAGLIGKLAELCVILYRAGRLALIKTERAPLLHERRKRKPPLTAHRFNHGIQNRPRLLLVLVGRGIAVLRRHRARPQDGERTC